MTQLALIQGPNRSTSRDIVVCLNFKFCKRDALEKEKNTLII